MIEQIAPDPNCGVCGGSGEVVDWVPYGSTNVPMYSLCECVEEQAVHEDSTIELIQPEPRGKPHEFFN